MWKWAACPSAAFLLVAQAWAGTAQIVPPTILPALNPTLPATPPTQAEDAAAVILLGMNATRMTVPVSVGDSGPYPFIIDTGAERTVVSRELAGALRLKRGPSARVISITGARQVGTVLLPSISVSAISGADIVAPALEGMHLGAPGMLGIDALQSKNIELDFTNHKMTVTASKKRGRSRGHAQPGDIVVRAKNLFGQLIVTEARLGDDKIKVIIDTGAAVSIGNSAFRQLAERHSSRVKPISVMSVTGDQLEADYALINGVFIGGVGINSLPVAFADVAPFRRFGVQDEPALLLGMDALRAFRAVNIDFANREIRFRMPDGYATPELGRWSVST